jgi:AraC-like DNA-binding protein/tetratricopeptide (TPR) repeat protein
MAAEVCSNAPSPRGVKRALDAMRANMGHDWTAARLAAAADVSSRTLQRQFRNFLGKSPQAILRDIRFEWARRKLLQGLRDEKVRDVALTCGLPHFGRFAREYRRRYGETPSQTVRRQAMFTKVLVSRPSFISFGRNRTKIALHPIDSTSENAEAARHTADELATALTRAGISVVRQPGSARYALTGAIRGLDRQTSLTLRLIETEAGRHLWAHRSSCALGSDSVLEQHLATRIVAALQPHLRLAEINRALQKPDIDLSSHDLALRALPGVLSLDAEGNARALDLLERARECDPDNAFATALAAWAHAQRVVYHLTESPSEERARGLDLARKAQTLAGDATVLAILGNALTLLKDLETADLVIRMALSFDGSSAWAWSRSGWIDLYKGNAESAIERLKIALDLAPHDPLAFNSMVGIGCANFYAGRYSEAARWQERALSEHPSAAWIHRTLCSAYAHSGAAPEAQRSLNALRKEYPDLTVSDVQSGMPPLPGTYCGLVADALHSVGLPP